MVDAVPLLVRSAGVKNYLYYWISSLRRAAGEDVVDTFPALGELPRLQHDASIAGQWRTAFGLGSLALANYTPLAVFDWAAGGASVFHASNLVRHPPKRMRLTTTLHDMTSWLMPELHPHANLRADRAFADLLRKADGIIAVSASTRDDAVRALGIPEERIAVIHSGVAEAFFSTGAGAVEEVRGRYGLERPFVLFIGTVEPRKNLDGLMDAWEALPAGIREEFDLVLAGPMGWASRETAARVRSQRYLGSVSYTHLDVYKRQDEHALDFRVVDGRKVRAGAGGDDEAGAAEQVDGGVFQTAFGDSQFEHHAWPP